MDRNAWLHCMKEDDPELWYYTPTGRKQYIHFDSFDEGYLWMKRNYKRIEVGAGSWQILYYFDILNGNETAI